MNEDIVYPVIYLFFLMCVIFPGQVIEYFSYF